MASNTVVFNLGYVKGFSTIMQKILCNRRQTYITDIFKKKLLIMDCFSCFTISTFELTANDSGCIFYRINF